MNPSLPTYLVERMALVLLIGMILAGVAGNLWPSAARFLLRMFL